MGKIRGRRVLKGRKYAEIKKQNMKAEYSWTYMWKLPVELGIGYWHSGERMGEGYRFWNHCYKGIS